jgi:hypothetical protein
MKRTTVIGLACIGVGVFSAALGRSDFSTWLAAAVVIAALAERPA